MAAKSKIEARNIALPKGGGAIKGLGESFSPPGFSGAASLSMGVPTSGGRGLEPSLAVAYSSAGGNGTFGMGFRMAVGMVARKTQHRRPRYDDSDTYECDEGELVRALDKDLQPVILDREWEGRAYRVHSYRPRHEGSYPEIEHWVEVATGQSFWRMRSSGDHLEYYGLTAQSRIVDPEDPTRVFQWLLDEEQDDHGNLIRYHYRAENAENVPDTLQEAGRDHSTQRYPILIEYGNYLYEDGGATKVNFSFQVVLDYGQVSLTDPADQGGTWSYRADPFSDYVAGFEVRTLRLCRRILLYHQFHDQNGGQPFLVHALAFTYTSRKTGLTLLQSVTETGYRLQGDGQYWGESIPALTVDYTPFAPELSQWQRMEVVGAESLAGELGKDGFLPVDLHGEGLPGMLYTDGKAAQYFAPMGEGRYAASATELRFPIDRNMADASLSITSLNGNGRKDLQVIEQGRVGYYPSSDAGRFEPWLSMQHVPAEIHAEHTDYVDLDGDGLPDLVIFDAPYLRYYPSEGAKGFGQARLQELGADFPAQLGNYREEVLDFMDILGDGLSHRVRIRAGSVEVWPNLGHGRFGSKVMLGNAPQFGGTLDVSRLHFADIDGSGTMDFVYVFPDRIEVYFNQSGNAFSEPMVMPLPECYDDLCQVNFMDVRGNGTTCMVLSKTHVQVQHHYLDFCQGHKPYLLHRTDNGMGLRTQLHYSSTVQQYLQDKRDGRPWATRLFFPVHVVTMEETREYFNHSRYVQRYAYHDGYYDPVEREFRGFGFVESWDTDHYEKFIDAEAWPEWQVENVDKQLHVWPTYTKTWYLTGAYEQQAQILKQYHKEYWSGDAEAFPHLESTFGPEILAGDADTYREAFVALAGQVLRSEVYGLDRTELEGIPYSVSESAAHVRLVQPRAQNQYPVFQVDPGQSFSYAYDRNAADPLITQSMSLAVDAYGHELLSASIAYPRRDHGQPFLYPEQQVWQIGVSQSSYIQVMVKDAANPLDDCRLIGLPYESKGFQLNGVKPSKGQYFSLADLRQQVEAAMQDQIPYHEPFAQGNPPQAKLQSWSRTIYWNADQSAAEAGGVAHKRALVHHDESAEIAQDQANALYASKFPKGNLNEVLNKEAGYYLDEGYWWNRGLIQYYATDPRQFYVPTQTDNGFADVPAGSSLEHLSIVAYDPYFLLPISTTVVLDGGISLSTIAVNDYTSMSAVKTTDPNGLVTQVLLDPLGQPIATTVFGTEGGKRVGDLDISQYVVQPDSTKESVLADPAKYLQGASSYFFYDFFAFANEQQPACAVSVTRQTHVHELPAGVSAPMQIAVAYSDSMGRALVGKAKEGKLWQCTGRTVYDNKNQPCQQYLPYQSDTSDFIPQEQFIQGKDIVPPSVLRYDPLGRVTRTDSPKGYFTRNVYSPWMHQAWDQNDTVKEAPFYLANINNTDPSFANNLDALQKAAVHYGTPTTVITDNLGHPIRSIVSNLGQVNAEDLDAMAETIGASGSDVFAALVSASYLSASGWVLPKFQPYTPNYSLDLPAPYNQLNAQLIAYLMQSCLTSFTAYDFQGRPQYTMDARLYYAYVQDQRDYFPNFQWTYAMEGNALLTNSADAGEHLAMDNIYGGICYVWDANGFTTRAAYDRLQRAVSKHVQGTSGQGFSLDQIVEFTVYGEHVPDAAKWNLNGKVYKHYGEDGMTVYPAYSIYGGPSRVEQRIRPEYKTEVAWDKAKMQAIEKEPAWVMTYAYNALGQVTESSLPDGSVLQCGYDEAGVQRSLSRMPKGGKMEPHILDIQYDANRQRTLVVYANGVQTRYTYEDTTLHLLNMRSTRAEKDAGNGKPGVKVLQDLSYWYDPSGNITRKEDTALADYFTFQAPASPLCDYTYNPLYQLIAATGALHTGHQPQEQITAAQQRDGSFVPLRQKTPVGSNLLQQYTQSYAYDNGGNLTQLSHATQGSSKWVRAYTIAPNSNRVNRAGKMNFAYDGCGNTITSFGPIEGLNWDFRNNIQQAQVLIRDGQDPDAEYYVYDSDNARVRKVWERMQQGGSLWEVEEKRYFGNYEEKRIIHRSATGERVILHRKTVRLTDGGSAFATIDTWDIDDNSREVKVAGTSITRYTLADAQGSANMELGAEGEVRSYEGYLPYGSIAFRAADKVLDFWTQDYGYSGKERDTATGLIYYGFRYYPPWLCRWMNPDPGGTVDGVNLYAFCGGNPVTHEDADGRMLKIQPTIKKDRNYNPSLRSGTNIHNFLAHVAVHNSGEVAFGSDLVKELKESRHAFKETKEKMENNPAYTAPTIDMMEELFKIQEGDYKTIKKSKKEDIKPKVTRIDPGKAMANHFFSNLSNFDFNKYGTEKGSVSANAYAIEHDPELQHLKDAKMRKYNELGLSNAANHTKANLAAYRKETKRLMALIPENEQREWLHIQAVEHGHNSTPDNLVCGVYGANRTMKAFESVVRQLVNKYKNSSTMSVSAKVTCTNLPETFISQNIRYKITVADSSTGSSLTKDVADIDIFGSQPHFPKGSGWEKAMKNDLRTFFGLPTT